MKPFPWKATVTLVLHVPHYVLQVSDMYRELAEYTFDVSELRWDQGIAEAGLW